MPVSPSASRATLPASTILVVDDSTVNVQVLTRILDGSGHRILVATNGKSAFDIAQRTHPDLILLDVMMPDMDGFEVCRKIKANDTTRDIVVIFLSALGEVADKVAGLQLGAVDYITKPIQAEEVLARVSNHLAVQRLERELRKNRDALDQELASAAAMQRLILPNPLPKGNGLAFAAHYETSRHVGGDYYDVVRIADEEFGVLIVDVSGHGAPSAIIMAMIRAVFHSFTGSKANPLDMLQFINRHFRFIWGSPILATAIYTVVNTRTLRMRMACCGHLPPLLLRAGVARQLESTGTLPLLLMDLQSIPCDEFQLETGDRVLFYTDGVTEAEDAEENMYEVGRLMAATQKANGLSPDELVRSLAADVVRFTGERDPLDDRTLLVMALE